MKYLRQSTATTVLLGGFVDPDDGKTPETALTIAQADVQLSKNGGAAAQKNDAASCTHIVSGHYACALNTTDTATVGRLRIIVAVADALPHWEDYTVLTQAAYDAMYDSSAPGPVTVAGPSAVDIRTEIDSNSTMLATIDGRIDTEITSIIGHLTDIKGGTFNGSTDSLEAIRNQGDSNWVSGPSAVAIRTELDSNSTKLTDILADTNELQQDWADSGRLDQILDDVLQDTNELQSDDVPGLIGALNDIDSAAVQSAAEAANVTHHLDHLFAAAYDPASKPGSATALWNVLLQDDGGVPRFTPNALEQAPTGSGGSTITAQDLENIADAVWDEAVGDHLGAGSTGNALNAAGAAGDPWSTMLPGAYGAGTAGHILGNNLDAAVSTVVAYVDTEVAAIKAVTDNLPNAGSLTDLETHLTDIKGPTFNGSTDSLEAIRNRGDAAWTPPSAAAIRSEIDSNSTQLAAIVQATTVDMPATLSTIDGRIDTEITAIINHLTDIKGPTFVVGTDSLEAIRNQGDASWSGSAAPTVEEIRAEMDSNSTSLANITTIVGTSGVEISGTTANKVADHVWRRNSANIAASSDGDALQFRSPMGAIRKLTNWCGVVSGSLQIRAEDDTTIFGTQLLATDPAAEPIVSMDTQ